MRDWRSRYGGGRRTVGCGSGWRTGHGFAWERGFHTLINGTGGIGPIGGHNWLYFVTYQPDIGNALQELRHQEFVAGRYNPVQRYFNTMVTSDSPALGARHVSIEEAVKAAGSEGTRSILDMNRIGQEPNNGVVVQLPRERLVELFGTQEPTRATVEANDDFFDDIERGQGVYIMIYEDGKPSEICFAGYSYD